MPLLSSQRVANSYRSAEGGTTKGNEQINSNAPSDCCPQQGGGIHLLSVQATALQQKSPRSLLLFDHKLLFTASFEARRLRVAEGLRVHSFQDGVLMRDNSGNPFNKTLMRTKGKNSAASGWTAGGSRIAGFQTFTPRSIQTLPS